MPKGRKIHLERKILKVIKKFKSAKGYEEEAEEVWIKSTEISFPVCPNVL